MCVCVRRPSIDKKKLQVNNNNKKNEIEIEIEIENCNLNGNEMQKKMSLFDEIQTHHVCILYCFNGWIGKKNTRVAYTTTTTAIE